MATAIQLIRNIQYLETMGKTRGVEIDPFGIVAKCMKCGYKWDTYDRDTAKLKNDWWKCPSGCNTKEIKTENNIKVMQYGNR